MAPFDHALLSDAGIEQGVRCAPSGAQASSTYKYRHMHHEGSATCPSRVTQTECTHLLESKTIHRNASRLSYGKTNPTRFRAVRT